MINKAENRYVFIDTETGGLIPGKHSLLSIGIIIWENNKGILDSKEFFIKHDKYIVTQEARGINKFNENEHSKKAVEAKIVISSLLEFINQYFDKNTLIPLIGHNIQFDINFIKILFKENNRSFNRYFSHRIIDTYSIYKTMVLADLIKVNINSSSDAFKYYGIIVKERHSALSDCIATVELYEKILLNLKFRN